ncbi:hypothetical protein F4779DRAFT_559875 [Xylariaceae sp. FL0662B]|nr:hypothetical protein F4779DRAFT_559875 [Xylariaceae sp. FL0662B]
MSHDGQRIRRMNNCPFCVFRVDICPTFPVTILVVSGVLRLASKIGLANWIVRLHVIDFLFFLSVPRFYRRKNRELQVRSVGDGLSRISDGSSDPAPHPVFWYGSLVLKGKRFSNGGTAR